MSPAADTTPRITAVYLDPTGTRLRVVLDDGDTIVGFDPANAAHGDEVGEVEEDWQRLTPGPDGFDGSEFDSVPVGDGPDDAADVDRAWLAQQFGPTPHNAPAATPAAGQQEGSDPMFGKRANGFSAGPGTGPSITTEQRRMRSRALRARAPWAPDKTSAKTINTHDRKSK